MRNLKYVGWPISLILLLALAGCFQGGTSGLDAVSVAQNLNPTFTPLPGEVVEVVVTATLDPFAPTPDPFGAFPTADFGTGGAAPTIDPLLLVVPTQDFAVVQEPLDETSMTVTAIIARATEQEAINMTLTANPFFVTEVPTNAFATPDPNQGVVQPIVPGTDCVHEVLAGENLYRLSILYGVGYQEIANASGVVNINQILVGQRLTIPGCGTTGVFPPPTSIPSGTTVDAGAGGGAVVDNSGVIAVGTGSCASPYTVVQGDTLFKISLRCGVPVMSIAAANPSITNIAVIVINQQIVIPAS
jgi:LysM repeat protein